MPTGQASTQAMQVVHDHSVTSLTTSPATLVEPLPASGPVGCGRCSQSRTGRTPDWESAHWRRSRTRSRGDSGAPATWAGQATWQRPHLVQASRSSSSFQLKSASTR
jgi:hypothetical protein